MSLTVSRASRPMLPFVGICGLALAATALRTTGTDWSLVAVAALTTVVLGVIACASPWTWLLRKSLPALPFAVDGVLALLRHAQGGSTSGYSPLAVLPVVWVAVTYGRRAVAAITVSTSLLFALPILLVGGPMYPNTGWRSVVLWTVVAFVTGTVVRRVVSAHRDSVALASHRTKRLDRLIETQTRISTSDLDVTGLMMLVAREALAIAEGDGACVELLEGDEVVCRGAAGTAVPFLGLRLRADESITGACFRAGQILICSDSEEDSRVGRDACRTVGARSLIVVPLIHGGEVKAVLIAWSIEPHDFRGYESQLLALLAGTSGSALVRAELITRLKAQAVTDELTGLPNRRGWGEHLDEAMARANRSGRPLSVLLLDLDHFKQVNDRHGHAAGDQVLKKVSASWLTVLRDTDLLGRLGGDEFAVILEDANEAEARRVIVRLDLATRAQQRASSGMAIWDGQEDAAALLARADQLMYRCKSERTTHRQLIA